MQLACLAFRRALQHPVPGTWETITIPVRNALGAPPPGGILGEDVLDGVLPRLMEISSWLIARQAGQPLLPPPHHARGAYGPVHLSVPNNLLCAADLAFTDGAMFAVYFTSYLMRQTLWKCSMSR